MHPIHCIDFPHRQRFVFHRLLWSNPMQSYSYQRQLNRRHSRRRHLAMNNSYMPHHLRRRLQQGEKIKLLQMF
jgi:hypothetical protein